MCDRELKCLNPECGAAWEPKYSAKGAGYFKCDFCGLWCLMNKTTGRPVPSTAKRDDMPFKIVNSNAAMPPPVTAPSHPFSDKTCGDIFATQSDRFQGLLDEMEQKVKEKFHACLEDLQEKLKRMEENLSKLEEHVSVLAPEEITAVKKEVSRKRKRQDSDDDAPPPKKKGGLVIPIPNLEEPTKK